MSPFRFLLFLLLPSLSVSYPFNLSTHIDCGGSATTVDQYGITWISDRYFTGGATSVVSEPLKFTLLPEKTVRFFPSTTSGTKNCYLIPVPTSSSSPPPRFFFRTFTVYDNYDGKNHAPSFEVSVEGTVIFSYRSPWSEDLPRLGFYSDLFAFVSDADADVCFYSIATDPPVVASLEVVQVDPASYGAESNNTDYTLVIRRSGIAVEGGRTHKEESLTIKMGSKPGVRTSKSNGQNKSIRSASAATTNLWLSDNPSQRWGELFFLLYTPFWLTLCLGIVVPFKLYENFKELEYLLLALISAVPSILIPLLFVGKADKGTALKHRYWVKASVWIVLFSYVGNYFWTHYFFTVLGASYTFPSWRMNDIPHTTFLLTHVCFLFYHVSSNMTLRRLRHSISHLPVMLQWLMEGAWVLALSYFIAWLETIAISNFPYYEFVDRDAMYKVGSLFYAIYFFVSFPMFRRIDESPNDKWDLPRVAVDALGAAMLVTIILDLWRLFLGPIVTLPETKQCLQSGLPWFSGH